MPVRFEEETEAPIARQVRFEEEPESASVPWEKSMLYGAGQGATFGFADEGLAGAKAIYDKATKGGKYGDLYKARVEQERKDLDEARRANPGSYLAGNVAGSLPTMAVPGLGIARGTGLGMSLVKAGAQGALMGAGESQNSLLEKPKQLMADVGKGAGYGVAAQGVFSAVGRGMSALGPKALKKTAEERAVKAVTGQNISALRKMTGTTLRSAGDIDAAEAGLRKVGRDILDEPGVLGAADKVENIAPRLAEARKSYGAKIGQVGSGIDKIIPKSVDTKKIANEIMDYASTIPETEGGKRLQERLMAEAANFEKMSGLGFEEAQAFKNQFMHKAVDADALISNQDATNKVRSIISKNMEDTADKMSKVGPAKDLLSQYKQLKSKYGSFKNASDAATDRVQKNLSNRFVSPSDYGVGAATGVAGALIGGGPQGFVIGAMGAAANKFARERGSALVARTADSIAKAMAKSPKAAQQFGQLLIDASKRGPAALAVTHTLLMKRPEYKVLFED